jgi:hypothetical protein
MSPNALGRDTWRLASPGWLLASAVLLPFLGKAHTIDDVTFLLQAQHATRDFWHPTAFEMVSDGERIRLSSELVTGPLMAWLLIPCVSLGGAEWAAHLLQWLLVCVTILCTVRIAARLELSTTASRAAGLFVAACPAVIGMATTSMSDVPAMAFTALGLERFLAWVDDRRPEQGAGAALALACAGLARSHALVMPLVASLALVLRPGAVRGGRIGVALLPLVASWLLAVAVMFVTADPAAAHGTILDAIRGREPLHRVGMNVAGFGAHWLATVPLALPWAWARARVLVRDVVSWLAFAIAVALLVLKVVPKLHAPLAVATALAFVVLIDVLMDAWRRRDRAQLLLGVWLLPALAALTYVQLPCKFLLVSVPAAALLVARLMEREQGRLPAAVAGAVMAAATALGVLIVLADSEFANAGRRAALTEIAPRVRAGERVRFYGAWGVQWYAMQAGAEVAAAGDAPPAPGDVLVASVGTPGTLPGSDMALEPLSDVSVTSHFGQVMSRDERAGFYSNWYGYLPWTWKNGLIERIVIWKVH